jgi:hypothetical protein
MGVEWRSTYSERQTMSDYMIAAMQEQADWAYYASPAEIGIKNWDWSPDFFAEYPDACYGVNGYVSF